MFAKDARQLCVSKPLHYSLLMPIHPRHFGPAQPHSTISDENHISALVSQHILKAADVLYPPRVRVHGTQQQPGYSTAFYDTGNKEILFDSKLNLNSPKPLAASDPSLLKTTDQKLYIHFELM